MSKKILRKKHEQQKTGAHRIEIISDLGKKASNGAFGKQEMKRLFALVVSMSIPDFCKVTHQRAGLTSAAKWQKGENLGGLGLEQANKLLDLANIPSDLKAMWRELMAYTLEGDQPEQMSLDDDDQLYQSRPDCTYQPRHECVDAEQVQDQVKDLDQQIKAVRHHQAEIWAVKDEIFKRLDGLDDHLQGLQQRVLGNEFHHDQLVTELRRAFPTAGIFEVRTEDDHV